MIIIYNVFNEYEFEYVYEQGHDDKKRVKFLTVTETIGSHLFHKQKIGYGLYNY